MNAKCLRAHSQNAPEKLVTPGRFLIPCDFREFDNHLALADLGASINLMPLSIWKKLGLPDLTSTRMVLELADRTISKPLGILKYVRLRSENSTLSQFDFCDIELVANPCSLIFRKAIFEHSSALIDVYEGESSYDMMINL
ncbi:reverse transcriptase domain-containing protein [Tanacetum coccineum]